VQCGRGAAGVCAYLCRSHAPGPISRYVPPAGRGKLKAPRRMRIATMACAGECDTNEREGAQPHPLPSHPIPLTPTASSAIQPDARPTLRLPSRVVYCTTATHSCARPGAARRDEAMEKWRGCSGGTRVSQSGSDRATEVKSSITSAYVRRSATQYAWYRSVPTGDDSSSSLHKGWGGGLTAL